MVMLGLHGGTTQETKRNSSPRFIYQKGDLVLSANKFVDASGVRHNTDFANVKNNLRIQLHNATPLILSF